VALAGAALATGWIAARTGLRPEPFYPGIAFVVVGLALSAVLVRETSSHVALETQSGRSSGTLPSATEVFWRTTLTDRNLSTISQAGLVNNLNDGMAWGLFPMVFATANLGLDQIGALAAIYPATWGIAQIGTGALSDRLGRKWLIASGMWVQALGIAVVIVATSFKGFATGGVLLGIGTAMVYPTLLAAIGDVALPSWRASAVGVYRLWRDFGYVVGALLAGITADLVGISAAVWLVAAITLASGVVVALRMDSLPARDRVAFAV
jgi:MFS family permease